MKVPAWQAEQADEASAEYLPAPQETQKVEVVEA
jgi:hypothetical protein